MDKWEAKLRLYDYQPNIDRYNCKVCGKLYKTDNGVYRHVGNHYKQINEIRDKEVLQ